MHTTRTLLIILGILLAIVAAALIVSLYLLPQSPQDLSESLITPVRPIVVDPPSRTKGNTTAALKQTMFSVLVSYVDGNFEPKTARIKIGDTIRWVNNTASDLKLCGTAFDCKTLKPGEYWEFTFDKVGTWSYSNDLNASAQGSVAVR